MTTHETADIEVLSTKECWELLRDSVVGRLAVTVDGRPDIFPVNPVVDHGSIVFRTSAGTKLAATKDREVAFEVDGYDVGSAKAWSVVVKGRANEIWEVDEILRALRLPLAPWQPGRKPRFVRNFMTGHDSPLAALQSFDRAVKDRSYPAAEHNF